MINPQDFRIRCSQIGAIMTQPKTKADREAGKLSATAQVYCKEWLVEQLYGIKKDIDNKYLQKGRMVEEESINYLNEIGYGFMLEKNTVRLHNEFMEGECDILLPGKVIDVKNCWDAFTFFDHLTETRIVNKMYYYQLQGYMHLYEVDEAELVYILMNTPESLVYSDNNPDYTKLDKSLRVKSFKVYYDIPTIEDIERQVKKCRVYIEELLESMQLL